MAATTLPDAKLLKEAADWALTLQYEAPSEAQYQAFEHWRESSPEHAQAWERAQSVFHTFSQVPAGVGKKTLKRLRHDAGRRRSLSVLGALLVAAPAAWLSWRYAPWQAWLADEMTATGERKHVALPDGTQMLMNTATAVNIAYTPEYRRIQLVSGEILVTTHADNMSAPRPFLVETPCGVIRALGTRFSVRRLNEAGQCRVQVFEHAVELRPLNGAFQILHAGEQADFGAEASSSQALEDGAELLWEKGVLQARNMPLGEVIAEIARYRPGVLLCDPAVAGMPVSGAISLMDSDMALDLLTHSLPVRIEKRTPYWVKILARN